jgi:hypothetical protein
MIPKRLGLLGVVLVVLATSACSNLGRSLPDCDEPSGTTVISVQSVPGTNYVPCINGLPPGWEYHHLRARSGGSEFWLDSDRMGEEFLTVKLDPSCDFSSATPTQSDEEGVPLFVDVQADIGLSVTIVPEGRSAQALNYATAVELAIHEEEVRGRTLLADTDTRAESTQTRISQARAGGGVVIVVSPRDAEEGTVTLILPGQVEEIDVLDFTDVLDEIEDAVSDQSYRGWWYYPFAAGCVTYEFDAEGDGVASIEADVQAALGLFDAEILRQVARDSGYRIP